MECEVTGSKLFRHSRFLFVLSFPFLSGFVLLLCSQLLSYPVSLFPSLSDYHLILYAYIQKPLPLDTSEWKDTFWFISEKRDVSFAVERH
ncbi:hypothetical protein C0J52_04129 [Blattella germanica]|nr:hypothetical protein C0J52_04129 [Blattella germanica]